MGDEILHITRSELERIIDRSVNAAVSTALRENAALRSLSQVLVSADHVTRAKGLSPKTISQNTAITKYNQPTGRKLLMKLEDVQVVKNRKRGDRK